MARLFCHQGEQDESKVAGAEDAPTATATTEAATAIELGTIAVTLVRSAAALAPTAASHGAAARVEVLRVFAATATVAVTEVSVSKHQKALLGAASKG